MTTAADRRIAELEAQYRELTEQYRAAPAAVRPYIEQQRHAVSAAIRAQRRAAHDQAEAPWTDAKAVDWGTIGIAIACVIALIASVTASWWPL